MNGGKGGQKKSDELNSSLFELKFETSLLVGVSQRARFFLDGL